MAAAALSSSVVENIAHDLLNGVPVATICLKRGVSQPTVTAVRKGKHQNLTEATRANLLKMPGKVRSLSIKAPAPKKAKEAIQIVQAPSRFNASAVEQNMLLRKTLANVLSSVTQCFEKIDADKACA